MMLQGKTLNEIWTILGPDKDGHTLNMRDDVALETNTQGRDRKDFTIMGVMNNKSNREPIFFGWYVVHGIAKVWSASGDERPEDIYANGRWVLDGSNHRHKNIFIKKTRQSAHA